MFFSLRSNRILNSMFTSSMFGLKTAPTLIELPASFLKLIPRNYGAQVQGFFLPTLLKALSSKKPPFLLPSPFSHLPLPPRP